VSVSVLIFHPAPRAPAGPLTSQLWDARRALLERHHAGFLEAGADRVRVIEEPADDTSFGARLRRLAASRAVAESGVVLLGSGAVPLATAADRGAFVAAARGESRTALANNRYSADIVALPEGKVLRDVPDLPSDNGLPRWLEEHAGFSVSDLRSRWRLEMDLDSLLDAWLIRRAGAAWLHALDDAAGAVVARRAGQIRAVLDDPNAELLVAGRTSTRTLAWLEAHSRCRIRAFVEERGLRASSQLTVRRPRMRPRPARSLLGSVLDREGPLGLGPIVAQLADAALIDSRVLLAHRLGVDEDRWPLPEDRFASDMLLPGSIADAWLRVLTTSAAQAPIPILLGGHSLVGPGARLLAAGSRPGSG
jgi:hypothetical protein